MTRSRQIPLNKRVKYETEIRILRDLVDKNHIEKLLTIERDDEYTTLSYTVRINDYHRFRKHFVVERVY